MPAGPTCASSRTVKNGRIHNGKQRFIGVWLGTSYGSCGRV
ncbi:MULTISPECIES: IS1/IS1595 family N-terminal zinc-binding domain-containing protein [unclassified Microcoleus]